ncbi:MAG TPA: transglycosylase family protein [Streptosporangiaceae bacterium]|nr:transglycosylase family protein [Streptosporangiaceae bacterium]
MPALAGMAAAVCLAPQAQADPAPAHAAAQTVAAAQTGTMSDALSQAGISPAELFAAVRKTSANPSRPARYTVRSGDSLSAIAGKVYHKQNAWTVLYWANRGTIHWANMISEGQVLKVPALPAKIPAAPSQLGPAPAPAPAPAAAPVAASSSVSTSAPARATVSGSYSGASGSYQACVIARESGGNSQVMNSSGHYGLYQFSASTWAAYGGSSGDFGHASVSEQNRVFNNAMAQGGQSNWSPYDGC